MRHATPLFMFSLITTSVSCAPAPSSPEVEPALAARAVTSEDEPTTVDTPIGLALDIDDGRGTPLSVRAGQTFYVNQIDIRASALASTDEGVAGLAAAGDFASLDWSGLALADEEPVPTPNPDGTFVRRRFYRGARWMEGASTIVVEQLDARGHVNAAPWTLSIGSGSDRRPGDDFFVRRLRAIQFANDCATPTDCSSATSFVEEALVELRHATHAAPAIRFQPDTTQLRVRWLTARPREYLIPVTQVAAPPFDYNLQIAIDPITPTTGGSYPPGSSVTFRVTYRDGSGNRLHPEGSLQTYLESLVFNTSGLQYWNPTGPVATYWRRKHREHQMLASITGPAQLVQPVRSTLGFADLASPDSLVTSGTFARDGVFAQAWSFPSFVSLLTGDITAPVSDTFTFNLPADAVAGTYFVTIKVRRNYLGQEIPVSKTIEIQVGTATRTTATLGTGPCNSCHTGGSALSKVLHGNDNRATCATCHAPLTFEPEGPIAVRLHFIHSRSGRLGAPLTRCATCHLDTASIQRTSQSACLSCHESYPPDHVASFGPITSAYVGGTTATAFNQCTSACHTTHPNSGL